MVYAIGQRRKCGDWKQHIKWLGSTQNKLYKAMLKDGVN